MPSNQENNNFEKNDEKSNTQQTSMKDDLPIHNRDIKILSVDSSTYKDSNTPTRTNTRITQDSTYSESNNQSSEKLKEKNISNFLKNDSQVENNQKDSIEPIIELEEENIDSQDFKLYKYRHFIVVLYIFADFANTLLYNSFTPIAAQMTDIYSKKPFSINFTSLIFMFLLPTVTPLANYVLDKFGFANGVKIGLVLTVLGGWSRLFVNDFFEIIWIGNVLAAIGAPFIYNCKSIVSVKWFGADSRNLVTTLISFFTLIGSIVAIMIPGLWFEGFDSHVTTDFVKNGQKLTKGLMLFSALMSSGIALIVFIFLKNKPKKPPSYSAIVKREDFKIAIGHLRKNKNYVLTVLGSCMAFGGFSGFSVSMSFIIVPYGFDSTDASYMMGVIPIFALLGIATNNQIQKRFKIFKKMILISLFISILTFLSLLLLFESENLYISMIGPAMIGFFNIPLVPMVYEYSVELVFPVGEGSALGFLMGFTSIAGSLFVILFSGIIKGETKQQSQIGVISLTACFFIALILFYFTKEDLRRTNYEHQQEKISQEKHKNEDEQNNSNQKLNNQQDLYKNNNNSNDNNNVQLNVEMQQIYQQQNNNQISENNNKGDTFFNINIQKKNQECVTNNIEIKDFNINNNQSTVNENLKQSLL